MSDKNFIEKKIKSGVVIGPKLRFLSGAIGIVIGGILHILSIRAALISFEDARIAFGLSLLIVLLVEFITWKRERKKS